MEIKVREVMRMTHGSPMQVFGKKKLKVVVGI